MGIGPQSTVTRASLDGEHFTSESRVSACTSRQSVPTEAPQV